ncbi:MAG: efflux RND transporter periplasmic adaptor subunit [Anaerotignum sp.]
MKKAVYVITAALCASLVCCACGGGAPTGMEQLATAVAVETEKITSQSIEQYVSISSKVSAEQEVPVIPQTSGTVKNVYVSLGDTVTKGQVLFEIDSTNAQIQVQQAQGSYSSAESSVETCRMQYEDLLKTLEQTQKMFEIGAASQNELDDIQSKVDQAKLQLETAEKSLQYTASASLASAQKQLSDTKVRAEISGIVSEMNVTEGSTVGQSSAMTLVNTDNLKVSFHVSEDVINLISVGSKVYVTVDAVSSEAMEVEVTGVSTAADSKTGLYSVEAKLKNKDGKLKPGMFANVKLVVEKQENVISVPLNTVLEKNGEKYVFVVDENNIAHKTAVTTGLKNDEYIEITSGLSIGDIVVTKGQDFLSDGNTVNITNGAAEEAAEEPQQEPQQKEPAA